MYASQEIDKFASDVCAQLFVCNLRSKVAYLELTLNGGKLDQSMHDESMQVVRMSFESALQSVEPLSATSGRLKDAYAYWLSALSDLFPSEDESESSHDRRMHDLQFQCAIFSNRLRLGD